MFDILEDELTTGDVILVLQDVQTAWLGQEVIKP